MMHMRESDVESSPGPAPTMVPWDLHPSDPLIQSSPSRLSRQISERTFNDGTELRRIKTRNPEDGNQPPVEFDVGQSARLAEASRAALLNPMQMVQIRGGESFKPSCPSAKDWVRRLPPIAMGSSMKPGDVPEETYLP